MSQILDCYKQILTALSLVVEDKDLISQKTPSGTLVPLKVSGKRLVLPTAKWLKGGFGEDYLPFHPLCEVMSREGTSDVAQMLQRQAKAVISYNLVTLASGLLSVAITKDLHKDLPIECTDFLKKLANADENTQALFERLLGAATKKNRLLTVYLKNGGRIDGKKVNRSAIIRFPILEDLQSDSKEVLGVSIPKKQRPMLVALFKLIVPFGDNPEEYSAGTTSRVAPYFTSLMAAYHKIATVLNQSIYRYGESLHLPVKSIELYDIALLDTFGKIYSEIPALSGNEGATNDQPEEASDTNVKKAKGSSSAQSGTDSKVGFVKLATTPSHEVVEQPSRQAENVIKVQNGNSKGLASMDDLLRLNNPQPLGVVQQPQLGFAPVQLNNGWNNSFQPVAHMPQAPINNFSPMAHTPPWVQAQQQQQLTISNPFMNATVTGRSGLGGGTGLI